MCLMESKTKPDLMSQFLLFRALIFHIMFSKSFHYAIGACGIMCYIHAGQNSDPSVPCAAKLLQINYKRSGLKGRKKSPQDK